MPRMEVTSLRKFSSGLNRTSCQAAKFSAGTLVITCETTSLRVRQETSALALRVSACALAAALAAVVYFLASCMFWGCYGSRGGGGFGTRPPGGGEDLIKKQTNANQR